MQNDAKLNSPENLKAIDKLEIGPVVLARNRLTAPYIIHLDGKVTKTSLIYKYEKNVFQPNNPGDQNLANVIAAQVAMNYGLFCNQITFYGLYDQQDQRFIREMTENTSREIYVKKFL